MTEANLDISGVPIILVLAKHVPSIYLLLNVGRKAIQDLRVRCDSVDRKCKWEGTVKTLGDHMPFCQLALLPCPKQCRDSSDEINQYMRKDLDHHMERDCPNRDYRCQHCGKEGTYATITLHDQTCDLKIIPCPNTECTKTMQRQRLGNHIDCECEHTVIACKYDKIGCEVRKKRKSIRSHEREDRNHLHMAIDTTLKLEKENSVLKNELRSAIALLEERQLTLKDGEITLKLTDYQKRKREKALFSFLPFYSHSRGYHMTLSVYVNGRGGGEGTHMSVFMPILEGRYDDELKWPFTGRVTFTLLNQLEDKNHHNKTLTITTSHNARVGTDWGHQNSFIQHSKLGPEIFNNVQYMKDDTLFFRVSVKADHHRPWLECTAQLDS